MEISPRVKDVDFFVWGDQVRRNKPYPDGIDFALEQHGTKERNGLYLGDNRHDVEAGRASRYNVLSAAALWGAVDRADLLSAGPDAAFETFREFTLWVTKEAGKV